MSNTLQNTTSVLVARIWSLGIGIVILPVYAHIMGFEAYGLVGFYATLQTSLSVLDFGLSSTLGRELSRASALNTNAFSICNLVFTIEIIYWIIGILLAIGLIGLAPYIATNWVNAENLSIQSVTNAIMLMGGIIAFQWPQSIYSGGLTGLQKLVAYNQIYILFSTFKSIGVIAVLKVIAPTIEVFFIWQMISTVFMVLVLRYKLWSFLPKIENKPMFSKVELLKIWRFAAGMTGIGLSTLLLGQLDKIVLSKVLSLEDYGYYSLAFTAGSSILIGAGVFLPTFLPKITELVAKGNVQKIADCYHRYIRIIASVTIPTALLMCFFSRDILLIWTQNVDVANKTWKLVSIVSIGYLFSGFTYGFYYLMLAYGWTRYTIYQNAISSIISIPLILLSVEYFGLTGGGAVCFVTSIGAFIIGLPVVHHKLLKGELRKVYFEDIGIPLMYSLIVIGLARFFYISSSHIFYQLLYLGGTMLLTLTIIIYRTEEYKKILTTFYNKALLRYAK